MFNYIIMEQNLNFIKWPKIRKMKKTTNCK